MRDDTGLNQQTWELMSQTGKAFFSSLVEHIAMLSGARIAFIVETLDLKGKHAVPLASWGAQGFRGEHSYTTQGTPCERLSTGATSIYLNNLPGHFPNDPWLLQSGMQSYIAIPLLDEHAQVLGHMGILDDREIDCSDKTITLLESFAHRTTEEIIRKRTLKKLRESEQHFRTLFDNSTCGLLFTDPETGQFLKCNPRICEMLGYSREELTQLSVSDIHREEDLIWVMEEFRQQVIGEKSQSLNVPVKRKDGSHFYANISSFWIKYQEKECLVGAFLDITRNRKTEQALRLEKEKLASYLDNAPIMTLVLDQYGTILLVNRAGCVALGKPMDEIIGENWFDQFLPVRLRDKMKQMFGNMIKGDIEPVKTFENPIINAQGKERLFAWHNSELRNKQGKIIAILSSGEDITEHQEVVLALQEQQARLAYAQKLTHVGSWELDLVDGNERWSDEAFRIFGYAPQAFKPSEARKLEAIHPDDRKQFQSYIKGGLATREQFDFEFRVQRNNDEIRIVRSLNYVTRDQTGKAISLLGTLQDITERRQAETQLKHSHEEMRQLADHLQSAREDERISIAREIHDEMAQSLTAQKIDLVRLNSRLPKDDPILKELSEAILDSINQTIHSVQRILTELRPALLDDLGLVAAIEWQMKEFQRRTEIQCRFSLPDEEPDLTNKERTVLFRIMQESLLNVWRHSKATEVLLELIVSDSTLLMNIIDNGMGISELEVLNSHSFGLMGMRERACIFGGIVNIHGKEGKGTTVSARIPLKIKQGKMN